MFNDLFWAIYWIDVLAGLPGHMVGTVLSIGALTALACGITLMGTETASYRSETKNQELLRVRKKLLPMWVVGGLVAFFFSMLMAFVPSKTTMYMMLGVKTTDNIVNSDTGKKLQKIIDHEIDGWLKKYEQK